MSAEALARLAAANLLAAKAASDEVVTYIEVLFDKIDDAINAWHEVRGMDSHIELRELKQAGYALRNVFFNCVQKSVDMRFTLSYWSPRGEQILDRPTNED